MSKRKLPKYLNVEEMDRVLKAPVVEDRHHVRDRCILNTLYRTGVRLGELVNLDVENVNIQGRELTVWSGKGDKDRIIPFDAVLRDMLSFYASRLEHDVGALFVSAQEARMHRNTVYDIVKKYSKRAGVKASPHTFRHSMAVHSLKAGMDVRTLQKILGHSRLSTTMVYLDITLEDVKAERDEHTLPI